MEYTVHQIAEKVGLTVPALHYYEKAGLMPPVNRNAAGHRMFTEENIEWLNMVVRLREADVPIRNIREYVKLLLQGPSTIAERHAMISQYQKDVKEKILAMQMALQFFDAKAEFYQKILESGQDIPCHSFSEEWALFRHSQMGDE